MTEESLELEPDWKYEQVTENVQLRWRWISDEKGPMVEFDIPGLAAQIQSATANSWQAKMVNDLSRCPHGRTYGDTCDGWTGPGPFDGGCYGGFSAGNPKLPIGQVFAVGISAMNKWVMPAREDKNNPEAWKLA